MDRRVFRASTRAAAGGARAVSRGTRATTVRWGAALMALCFAGLAAAQQQPTSRADCERIYKPTSGQSGKDVIWLPTPDTVVNRMLAMAKVTPQDTVIDLGAGDGKIAIAAGRLGANALGIEYNPDMVKLANCLVQVEGAQGKTRIIQGDIFKEDFSRADVLTLFLLPQLNLCVRHRILAMRPGTRVASHQFNMRDWDPDETVEVEARDVHLWVVPARVAGTWSLRNSSGLNARVELVQSFQKIGGEVTQGRHRQPLLGATLRGEEIRFAFNDDKGVTQRFTGRVTGPQLSGTLFSNEGGEVEVSGTLQGQPRAGGWTAMVAQCERFYSQ